MSFRELIAMALGALRASKLRSALTLLGMVIGVFAIIVSVTAVSVIESAVTSTVESFGSTKFSVSSRPAVQAEGRTERRRPPLPLTYAQTLLLAERTRLPTGISPDASEGGARLRAGGAVTDPAVTLRGSNEEWAANNAFDIEQGRFLTAQDVQFARPVIVLGADVAEKLFEDRNPVGQEVSADRGRYVVVGVFKKKGDSFGQSNDLMGVVPITRLFSVYGNADRDVRVDVRASGTTEIQETVDETIGALRAIRGVRPGEDNDFEVETNESSLSGFKGVASAVSLGGAGIGLMTLFAAGIGIMNIMLVSVTERTREIGVRKSLGARRSDVLRQFLIEAVVLCQIGGLLGLLLGVAVANVLTFFFDTPFLFPWGWAAAALGGVTFFGVTFGVYPAWKAAKLDPIDALRYE